MAKLPQQRSRTGQQKSSARTRHQLAEVRVLLDLRNVDGQLQPRQPRNVRLEQPASGSKRAGQAAGGRSLSRRAVHWRELVGCHEAAEQRRVQASHARTACCRTPESSCAPCCWSLLLLLLAEICRWAHQVLPWTSLRAERVLGRERGGWQAAAAGAGACAADRSPSQQWACTAA